jgi:hypothetical protein
MFRIFLELGRCTRATAAVEAAIFAPIFATLTLGVSDLGSRMFVQMQVDAAAQAGAAYAVFNCSPGSLASCLATNASNITAIMNNASGNPSFCSAASACVVSATCVSGSGVCVTVTATYSYSPILSIASGAYSNDWTKSQSLSYRATIRMQ